MNIVKLKDLIYNTLKYKFVSDSIYSLISFFILAISGILLNVIIGNYYSAAGLGVFNQSIALYTIISVLAVMGINISIIKFIAEYKEDKISCKNIFSSAFIITLLSSNIIVFMIYFAIKIKSDLFFNSEVTSFFSILLIGIPFFTLNKLFLALLNATRLMKLYSIIQSSRWILIFILIFIVISKKLNFHYIAYCFVLSDIILFIYLFLSNLKYFSFKIDNAKWYKTHIIFGGKSVLLGFISQTNNKIDIFFISFFLNNSYVGIYSFASEIIKGFLSFANIVQLNINPIISDLWAKKDIISIQSYTDKIARIMIIAISGLIVLAAISYPFFINIFMSDEIYRNSIPIFYILLIGIFFPAVYNYTGAYFAMANLLNVSFISLSISFAFNLIFAFIFINLFGIYGAAFSTTLTYFLQIVLIAIFSRKYLGIAIVKNPFK